MFRWKSEHLPNTRLRNVADVNDAPEKLSLVAANGQNILYIVNCETRVLNTFNAHRLEVV